MSGQGYFFDNLTPEQQAAERNRAYAEAMMQRGSGPVGSSPGAGLGSMSSALLGAFLAKRADKKSTDLATDREGSYTRALGNFLGPKDNSTWDAGPETDASGDPGQISVSPRVGASMAQRLGATMNPDLMRQMGPQIAQQQMNQRTTLSPEDAQAAGLRPGGVYQQGPNGEISTAQAPDTKSADALAQEPPQVRTIEKGTDTVTEQFDPKTRQWTEIGRGPRQLPPQESLPSGYRRGADGNLSAIPGGPADPVVIASNSDSRGADDAGWVTLTDPKTNTQYDHNPRTGKNRTLDGKPYAPSGAAKISTNTARSPAAMYLQKYQTEHPEATSGDLADVAATFGAQQKAVRDFATGPEGNIITRLNTAVSHLDTLQKIGMALDNGDVKAFNALRNQFREQFGSELPTNFNAAMPIVAGEVSKAIVGTQGGTREDRAELEKTLRDSASKRQLSGATGTQKALLQGQLSSRRKQYEVSTGRKDFDKFLSGETQKELGIDLGGSGGGAPANDPLGLFK